ncbi:MAG: 16S rRNA (guanine(966)-N(2))-methyltransferase RsmD [Ramlibacter sp.]|nr:16S rRNA (guanine(966)-N(2))-methyltransferase RsmD [Ramlibacter sp.]
MSKAAPARAHPEGGARHDIRIIGGQWKRTRLAVADKPGLRPTPDRVRETLFNWLGQDLTGWRCVDAFAGTGALGFEAASRGAASVLMLEHDAGLVAQLRKVQDRLAAHAVKVQRGDGVAGLKAQAAGSADLVLLDPPFDRDLFSAALQAGVHALAGDGQIYLEAPMAWDDAALQPLGLCVRRHLKAGAVHAHLLHRIA